jgi:hypothetical protein
MTKGIAVKGNQPNLLEYLRTQFEQISALSLDIQIEQCRDRYTQRTVSVLDTIVGIEPALGWDTTHNSGRTCWHQGKAAMKAKRCFTSVL